MHCDSGWKYSRMSPSTNNITSVSGFPGVKPDEYDRIVCATQGVMRILQNRTSGKTRWQHFTSETGVHMTAPAYEWPRDAGGQCSVRDHRHEAGYALASLSRPRDIVIVVDTSGSMRHDGRMEKARSAAITLVNSLSAIDRAQVVLFSSTAQSNGDVLVPADWEHRCALSKFINTSVPSGGVNFYDALSTAYSIFEDSAPMRADCSWSSSIILITDSSGRSPMPIVKKRDQNRTIPLFVFSIGSANDDGLKEAACV